MRKFTKELVDELAENLLIGLTSEENKMVLDEFEEIDKTIEVINEIEGISEVRPMTHALDEVYAEFRDDVAEESLDIKEILRNAGKTEGREIEIPKVVE